MISFFFHELLTPQKLASLFKHSFANFVVVFLLLNSISCSLQDQLRLRVFDVPLPTPTSKGRLPSHTFPETVSSYSKPGELEGSERSVSRSELMFYSSHRVTTFRSYLELSLGSSSSKKGRPCKGVHQNAIIQQNLVPTHYFTRRRRSRDFLVAASLLRIPFTIERSLCSKDSKLSSTSKALFLIPSTSSSLSDSYLRPRASTTSMRAEPPVDERTSD